MDLRLDGRPEAARTASMISASAERLADCDTPLSLFLKLGDEEGAFLFESAPGSGGDGRYSFFGKHPIARVQARGSDLLLREGSSERRERGRVCDALRTLLSDLTPTPLPTGRFPAGAVGFLAYDAVRTLERLPDAPPDDRGIPDADFFVPGLVYVYDHARRTLRATVLIPTGRDDKEARILAEAQVQDALRLPDLPLPPQPPFRAVAAGRRIEVTPGRETYMAGVDRIREAILAGDAFQVVPSMRIAVDTHVDPVALYRSLRQVNPSPYLFYLNAGRTTLVGSSPESLMSVEGDRMTLRPIAGTRPTGKTEADDSRLAEELAQDPKERAEHVMLVDLARNDAGRVCRPGSVSVTSMMQVERYSHVLHLVSQVEGRLRDGEDALSALESSFPAGTLSGAPKIRAMELIDEVERVRRGPYGGAVGYVSMNGNADFAIAIRTFVLHGGRAYIQAGAGVVADSVPSREWAESQRKAQALVEALMAAEAGL